MACWGRGLSGAVCASLTQGLANKWIRAMEKDAGLQVKGFQ
jgi:hypothetical protein